MVTIQLLPDFKEFLQLLKSHGVRYLVVGGYAVTFYGYPRATGDIDIWVAVDSVNLRGVALSLREFGFPIPDPPEDVLSYGEFLGLGVRPFRIEILTKIDGVSFEECYARRQQGDAEGEIIEFIGYADLKVNKEASGRHKDLNDLEQLISGE